MNASRSESQTTHPPSLDGPGAALLSLRGRVQGVGARPSIARWAARFRLTGFVANVLDGVDVHVEGDADEIDKFVAGLAASLPTLAKIESINRKPARPRGFEVFEIRSRERGADRSAPDDSAGRISPLANSRPSLATWTPPDVSVCDACLTDVRKSQSRREGYGFTSCTACGPRYSIIEAMPYERDRTTMSSFALCPRCLEEYRDPQDRRFHAQTNACPTCGPRCWLQLSNGRVVGSNEGAIRTAAKMLCEGEIVALRGIGGYQLLADAGSIEAVRRLRIRKRRQGKPFAVMVASAQEADRIAMLDDAERKALSDPSNPIVIVTARSDSPLVDDVSHGLNSVGVLLPTTPLHALLIDAVGRPLVCTSGNLEGEPLVFEMSTGPHSLLSVADACLDHDRPIQRPIDDSIVRVIGGESVTLRLARGLAPLPLDLPSKQPWLALGGHQKAAIALTNGGQAVLGPHIGDLDSVAARTRYLSQLDAFASLFEIHSPDLVCDRHPEYFSSRWASEQPGRTRKLVQHHHAHVAAAACEHGWLDREVLGVAWDGTGFGEDGAIWGGEFLLASPQGYRRVARIRPFLLLGGELAVRQPWRVATALVRDAAGEEAARQLRFEAGDPASLMPLASSPQLHASSTSAGRLFDAAAALILDREVSQFEGQAAMLLEAACDPTANGCYETSLSSAAPADIDWRPLIRQILEDRRHGEDPRAMAMRFHRAMARAIESVCQKYSEHPVVLGGGVFQNRVLVELLSDRFKSSSQELRFPQRIPPNDGGLAVGQLAIALMAP